MSSAPAGTSRVIASDASAAAPGRERVTSSGRPSKKGEIGMAGMIPAATNDDLPLPEGPITVKMGTGARVQQLLRFPQLGRRIARDPSLRMAPCLAMGTLTCPPWCARPTRLRVAAGQSGPDFGARLLGAARAARPGAWRLPIQSVNKLSAPGCDSRRG